MSVTDGEDPGAVSAPQREGAAEPAAWGQIRPAHRPARLGGFTERRETPLGTLFLTLNDLGGRPFEVFAQIGKAGSDVAAFTEAIARLVSLAVRCGVDPAEVAEQISGIGGSDSVGFGADRVRSVPDAIGQVLARVVAGEENLEHGGGQAAGGPGP